MIGIYKITSPTDRVYIGQSIDIEQGWKGYLYPINLRGQPKLKRSFKKYGFNNHQFQIIEECSIKNLDNRELFWKKVYLNYKNNDWSQVLFCELHDKGGGPKSKETKQKISETLLENATYKPVLQYNLQGELIKEWDSINQINEHYNLTSTLIQKACTGQIKSTLNSMWRYKGEMVYSNIPPYKTKYKGKKGKQKKKVYQFDLEGNFIKEWKSSSDVDKKLNTNTRGISACCVGTRKHHRNFIWKYEN